MVRSLSWIVLLLLCIASGCALPYAGSLASAPMIPNPLVVNLADSEFVHNQTVDALDDYFRIRYEQRVRSFDGVLAEGSITTFPLTGSTQLEPWRTDSTPGYEKWHASLQSIRRRCETRIIPTGDGFAIEVAVYKDLEDLIQPRNSTVGGNTLRYDNSIVQEDEDRDPLPPGTLGWIPLGRDVTLEQQILRDLQARLIDGAGQ